jgi:hypothetical protein
VTRSAADALKMNSAVLYTATNQITDSDSYDSNIGNKNPFTAEPPGLVSTARAIPSVLNGPGRPEGFEAGFGAAGPGR